MENSKKGAFAALGLNIDQSGLTKREYFAAMAMQGLCINANSIDYTEIKVIATTAVTMADALLKQLEQ